MIYDITRPLGLPLPVYPGDQQPGLIPFKNGGWHLTSLEITTHTGTHIDAGSHLPEQGLTLDSVPLTNLIGPCDLVSIPHDVDEIGPELIEPYVSGTERLLLKTVCSDRNEYQPGYPYLSEESARLVVKSGLLCLGTDAPSVDPDNGDGTTHKVLLTNGVCILENLILKDLPDGAYNLIALPLRVAGGDGAPIRAILSDKNLW